MDPLTSVEHAAPGAPPTLGIVVPVHNVAPYLPACLDSILTQSFRDLEVVAVDDASDDDSGAVLDRYADADRRLTVVHLAENVGMGAARNQALARLRSEYVLCVDSDDALAPGALQAIADRLVGSPDLVIFGFARWYPDGRLEPDPGSAVLAPAGVITLADRPGVARIYPYAWNKAYRRGFLEQVGIRFAPGYYEDVAWSLPLAVAARSIATLDEVCYWYRQRRSGNVLSSSGRRHLELFDQYDRAFDFLATRPDSDRWRAVLFENLAGHAFVLLDMPSRVPPELRREFFHAASSALRRHHPAGFATGRAARLRIAVIERDNYLLFRAAQIANRLRHRATRRATSSSDRAGT